MTIILDIEEVRLSLGMRADDTEHDDLIESLEARALAKLQRLTGRQLYPEAEITEIIDGADSNTLFLQNPPNAVTSVRYRFATGWADPWGFLTADLGTDVVVNGRGLYFTTGAYWPKGQQNIEVVYTAGYTAETFPADLYAVLLEMVSEMFRSRPLAVPATAFQGSPEFPVWRGLSADSRAIVSGYRRPGR